MPVPDRRLQNDCLKSEVALLKAEVDHVTADLDDSQDSSKKLESRLSSTERDLMAVSRRADQEARTSTAYATAVEILQDRLPPEVCGDSWSSPMPPTAFSFSS